MQIGDKVVCIYNEVDKLYEDSSYNKKLELNKTYTIFDKYNDIRDDSEFYVFLSGIHDYSYNNKRFVTLDKARQMKIDILCSKKKKKLND